MTPTPETLEGFEPTTQAELARYLADNSSGEKRKLQPLGGRTALKFGYPLATDAVPISLARLDRVVDYPARDMTVTVEAGIRFDKLVEVLREENQRIPIDVAQSHRATLGGVIASNTNGPKRFGHGTLRDYVIGVSAVDAQGRLFSAGGRVVKNVAGYDLCKLLIGSMGTLAVITQVTLKLRPTLETSSLVWMTFYSFAEVELALARLHTSETRPVAIEVFDAQAARQIATGGRAELPTDHPVLCLGYEGTGIEVSWQTNTVQRECAGFGPNDVAIVQGAPAEPLWTAMTEFQTFQDEPLTFQANLLPSRVTEFLDVAAGQGVAVQAHAGNGIVVGHFPDETTTLARAQEILKPLREIAAAGHGNLIVHQCAEHWKSEIPLFGEPEPSWPLMRKLKQQLDPHDLLNPGHFINGLPQHSTAPNT